MNFLSISSHVVHGYVGNKSINISIQYKPDVESIDLINTVQLNVHPKFISAANTVVPVGASKYDPEVIVRDIISKSLNTFLGCSYDCVIVSYFNSDIGIDMLSDSLHTFKNSVKIVDPIMGDNGSIYCSPLLIDAYKRMIKNNDIDCLLPNQFELELLTDSSECGHVRDLGYYKNIIAEFHRRYPRVKNLVVTSVSFGGHENHVLMSDRSSLSSIKLAGYHSDTIIYGCGDLFTGLFSYEFTKNRKHVSLSGMVGAVLLAVQLVINESIGLRVPLENVESANKAAYKYQLNGLDLVTCIHSVLAKSSAELIGEHRARYDADFRAEPL